MIVILTRSLCLVGCCGSFRWVRVSVCSWLNIQVILCLEPVVVPLKLYRACSPTWCLSVTVQVWRNSKVCVCFCLWVYAGVFVWWKEEERERESSWFHVLLAEELHSSLGILELQTRTLIVKYFHPECVRTHVWSNLHQLCIQRQVWSPTAKASSQILPKSKHHSVRALLRLTGPPLPVIYCIKPSERVSRHLRHASNEDLG